MVPLSTEMITAFRGVAQDGVGDFAERLDVILREECACPEFAGGTVSDFLESLPRCTSKGPGAPAIDACYAEQMCTEMRRILMTIVKEDEHTAEMLREAHGNTDVDISSSLDPDDGPSQSELDAHIRRTTGGDQVRWTEPSEVTGWHPMMKFLRALCRGSPREGKGFLTTAG